MFLQFLEPASRHPSVGPATSGLVLYQHGSDVDGVRVQLVWEGGERERGGEGERKGVGREGGVKTGKGGEGKEGREGGGWYAVCDKYVM